MDESEGRVVTDIMDRRDRELEMQRQTGLVPGCSLAASSAAKKVKKEASSG